MKTKEEFRDIQGYEGIYQVSNMGRVRSLDRKVRGPWDCMINKKGRILKTSRTSFNVETIGLHNDCKTRKFRVHKLVTQAFGAV